MRERSPRGTNGKLQAAILKKCDRTYHRPDSNKQCAGGTCQHTCEAAEVEKCRHAWTVRYTVNGVQRDKSFRDEIDASRRVRYGTGLKKAQDFQLELTRGKRAQGRTYVDPKAGNELFGPAVKLTWSDGLPRGAKTGHRGTPPSHDHRQSRLPGTRTLRATRLLATCLAYRSSARIRPRQPAPTATETQLPSRSAD
jgi:hypothetical protein